MIRDLQKRLFESDIFNALDIHFGSLMQALDKNNDMLVFISAALVSRHKQSGHACFDFKKADKTVFTEIEKHLGRCLPLIEDWLPVLKASTVVGSPGEFKPMIMDDSSRVYLNRYYEYQATIVRHIEHFARARITAPDLPLLVDGLNRLFPEKDGTRNNDAGVNFQRVAAMIAVYKQLCVISGGPGTGKTTTVTGIIALLQEQTGSRRLNVKLAAPTGKSAARLRESVKTALEKMNAPDYVRASMPDTAYTIHRLLGGTANTPLFKLNRNNRLDADIVIVDEASMIDLALMAKLLDALRDDAKLILIGDRHQLASVEAGAVFADICGPFHLNGFSESFSAVLAEATGFRADAVGGPAGLEGIMDTVVQLEKSYRFTEGSGIKAVSNAVRQGDGSLALSQMTGGRHADICLKPLPDPQRMEAAVSDTIIRGYEGFLTAGSPMGALERLDEFRVLCALREGPYGVESLNRLIELILRRKGLIRTEDTWYPGRPVMITVNDYGLGLFNGDTGVTMVDEESGALYVFFREGDNLRKIHPMRLSGCETAFALTIHKSQGSEYDRVLVVLPDRISPILTRELIYTGITRSKSSVEVLSDDAVFRHGVSEKIERASGLLDALWGMSVVSDSG